MPSARVETLSWDNVDREIKAGALPILPVGAASKEHGFHLPMNTDWLQAEWLAREAMNLTHALIWPTVNYGYYPAFMEYAGSCSVARQTFKSFMADLVDSILHTGAPKVFLINTGVSTIAPLDELARSPSVEDGLFLFHCALGPEYGSVSKTLAAQPFGGTHADELETSLMLHIAPAVVNMAAAAASPNEAPMQPGALRAKDAGHPNYSPSGVSGDPTRASAKKGRRLAQARLHDLQTALTACLTR